MRFKVGRSVSALALACGAIAMAQSDEQNSTGAVFAMTNSASKNEVLAYHRQPDGSLGGLKHYATGGRGSGGTVDPLGSQGSLTLSYDHSLLFAVNAGSGELSVFRVYDSGLELTDVVPTGGAAPNAVAQHGELVYVLNSAGTSSVAGFWLRDGKLTPIPKSLRYLSTGASGPSSLAFSPDRKLLLVTEKTTNLVDTFQVHDDGTLSQVIPNPNPIPGVFDVLFAPDGVALVVQTGPAAEVNASSISSYLIASDGTLMPVTAELPTLGKAACWVALTPNGKYLYVSNSGSSTIAGYQTYWGGPLTPLPGTLVAKLPASSTNLDTAITADSRFLYTLDTGSGAISSFKIQKDGSLSNLGMSGTFPAASGFNGLAAY